MALVTIRQTPIVLKNGKTAMLEENNWEFCENLWKHIKEFAGIYSFNINWDKVLLKNHHYTLSKMIRFTYSDSNKELAACHFKQSECYVRGQFWRKVNKGEFKEKKINKKNVFETLNKLVGVWTLSKDFHVGDEIQFYRCDYANDQYERAGKIISISPDRKSYKLEEYSYGEKKLDTMLDNNYDVHYIWDWDKTNTKISTIKSDKRIKKGLRKPTYISYYN
jgi:hypothetical protein